MCKFLDKYELSKEQSIFGKKEMGRNYLLWNEDGIPQYHFPADTDHTIWCECGGSSTG